MKYGILIAGVTMAGFIGIATFVQKPVDVAGNAIAAEKARVAALLAQDWDAVRKLAHLDFKHQESNGSVRTIDSFVEAMKWCGKDGMTPGDAASMPPGGGFSFASHDIDWKTVMVEVMPNGEDALVTGKYTNVLRRCFRRDDGTTGVETPTAAKPAAFVRYHEKGKIRYHRAMVDSAAPASSMSVNFPPPNKK